MAQWLRRVAVSWATWVRFLQGVKTLCRPLAIFLGTEPVSAHARLRLFFILLLSINFFPFDFLSGDLALTGF